MLYLAYLHNIRIKIFSSQTFLFSGPHLAVCALGLISGSVFRGPYGVQGINLPARQAPYPKYYLSNPTNQTFFKTSYSTF